MGQHPRVTYHCSHGRADAVGTGGVSGVSERPHVGSSPLSPNDFKNETCSSHYFSDFRIVGKGL